MYFCSRRRAPAHCEAPMLFRSALVVLLVAGCDASPKSPGNSPGPDGGVSGGDGSSGSDSGSDAGTGSDGAIGPLAFGAPKTYAAGSTGYYLTAADLDGNGTVDLVESSPDDAAGLNQVHVLRGSGTGAFTDVATIATSAPAQTVVSDFSGDGIADIAGIAWDGMGPLPAFYLQGEVGLRYAMSTWGDGRDFNGQLAGGDFNEDGKLDLVAPYFGGFAILKMPGFVVAQEQTETGSDTIKAVAGDFDGDGHQDVMVANGFSNVVRLYRGNGSGRVAFASR